MSMLSLVESVNALTVSEEVSSEEAALSVLLTESAELTETELPPEEAPPPKEYPPEEKPLPVPEGREPLFWLSSEPVPGVSGVTLSASVAAKVTRKETVLPSSDQLSPETRQPTPSLTSGV